MDSPLLLRFNATYNVVLNMSTAAGRGMRKKEGTCQKRGNTSKNRRTGNRYRVLKPPYGA